ncbi:MAG: dihydroorotate dehydrogenase-like protein [Proteobacteria bacterium]|nr:dihydroorotate dehydrogenase-like protein [Pseudomonadota bacterium]
MSKLETTYLGLALKNPLAASSSPLTDSVEGICALEDHGLAAVVLPSLFEEQLEAESAGLHADLERGSEGFAEATRFLPDLATYNLGPDRYLDLIRRARNRVAIPVIASLNGTTPGGWLEYARLIEQAGASALELNMYAIETDPERTGAEIEARQQDMVRLVRDAVTIPLSIKLSPFYSGLANMARGLDAAGADGLVLFNRFYQPDFDIVEREVVNALALSTPSELLPRLHWTAILSGRVGADLSITGGVHGAEDVVKCVMAGARLSFMASALLKHGAGYARSVLAQLDQWLDAHEYASVTEMCGCMGYTAVPDPAALERSNYMKVLGSYMAERETSV